MDDERRVILGAALLHKKHDIVEHTYPASTSPLKAMVWERPIQHTLRPRRGAGGFDGGFVMPYHAVIAAAAHRPDVEIKNIVAFAPDDARIQFS